MERAVAEEHRGLVVAAAALYAEDGIHRIILLLAAAAQELTLCVGHLRALWHLVHCQHPARRGVRRLPGLLIAATAAAGLCQAPVRDGGETLLAQWAPCIDLRPSLCAAEAEPATGSAIKLAAVILPQWDKRR